MQLQLFVQQGPLFEDFSLEMFFVLVQERGELGGILLGAFLLHHLFLLSFLSCLLLVLLNLVEEEFHHLVADDHPEERKERVSRWFIRVIGFKQF